MTRILLSLFVAGLCVFNQSYLMAASGDLSRFTNSGRPVKVFVGSFTNESGQPQINAEEFKKSFERALNNRKSVAFKVVPNEAESDVQISCAIKKYLYSKTDPITSYGGTATLILDAVTVENYVEMITNFVIKDTRIGTILWSSPLTSYIKHMMTPDESIPKIYDKASRDFLWRSFGKPDNRR